MSAATAVEVPELKSAKEIAEEVQGVTKAPEPDDEPRLNRNYEFDFSYKDLRGKIWAGKFRNQILSIGQKNQRAVIKARLAGGVPVAALDADAWAINEAIAHLSVSLVDRPDWAIDLQALMDEQIVDRIYQEVMAHEAIFHGRPAEETAGALPTGNVGGNA